jgi:hypothetical protein
MSRRSWVLVGAAIVVMAAVVGVLSARRDPSAPEPSGSLAIVDPSPAAAGSVVTASPGPSPSPTPRPTPTPAPPAVTPPPRASGPARLAYADFLRRINADRATVERLNASLTTAVQALDPASVRTAAVDILDFVDGERDWLRENPPAACYADAHASAGAMLDAYGAAADAFIAWAETGGGFAGLTALADAVDAATSAGDALTTFGHVLEATSCPA